MLAAVCVGGLHCYAALFRDVLGGHEPIDRSGDAVTCVLAAYGNVISMSIDTNRKGLSLIRSKIENNTKLLSKDAGTLV
eukprot:COSAG01_NODE_31908_length_589_cov_1.818367_1_plen_79_part_00